MYLGILFGPGVDSDLLTKPQNDFGRHVPGSEDVPLNTTCSWADRNELRIIAGLVSHTTLHMLCTQLHLGQCSCSVLFPLRYVLTSPPIYQIRPRERGQWRGQE